MRKILFIAIILLTVSFVDAESILHTPEIITVTSGDTRLPISLFNSGNGDTFAATFQSRSGDKFASILNEEIFIDKEDYGSFEILLDADSVKPGIYFGEVVISSTNEDDKLIVPTLFGRESDLPRNFDVSIEFNEDSGFSILEDEANLDLKINVYKLDYNPSTLNNVVLEFYVYDLQGNVIDFSQETVSVSTRSSFNKFVNLGDIYPSEIVFGALVRSQGETWLDVLQVPLKKKDISLSPPLESSNYWIYLGVFIFLIASIIVLSYFWSHKVAVEANQWKSKLADIKKYTFSDSNKALRKLAAQREILQRAYESHFISRNSYLDGMSSIDKMSKDLKKRL